MGPQARTQSTERNESGGAEHRCSVRKRRLSRQHFDRIRGQSAERRGPWHKGFGTVGRHNLARGSPQGPVDLLYAMELELRVGRAETLHGV